jgi:starch synthase
MSGVKVLAVVSEIYPLVKTGGLADVAGALPRALCAHDVAVTTLVPGYRPVIGALGPATPVWESQDLFGGPARLLAAHVAELDLLVLDAPHLYARPGNPYGADDGHAWPDNALRFGALAWIAAQIGVGEAAAFRPDIVHAHDWQAGLTPAYLTYDGRKAPPTVMTVHNLSFQGQFPASLLGALRLPARAFAIEGVEYYGGIGFLKSGLQFADRITTVSPTYAAEIQTPENGCGLDPLLRRRASVLYGILNGIDVEVWNPATDTLIASQFDRSRLAGRAPNKAALQKRLALDVDPGRLLFGFVGRLTWQKGVDILADVIPALLDTGAQLALLGTGDREIEQRFTAAAAAHRGQIGSLIGYDEGLAHLIQAGADALLVPSRFEPCGLTQLCALLYGAVPVVAKVGGLADTVIDLDNARGGPGAATGLTFSPVARDTLVEALRRTAKLWREPMTWSRLQANGMATDVSWSQPADRYAKLYAELMVAQD